MKTLILILSLSISIASLAGGGGGGGGQRPGLDTSRTINDLVISKDSIFIKDLDLIKINPNTRIVIAKPSENGVTEFATGTIVNRQWQINRYAAPTEIIERSDSDIAEQMKKSLDKKDWIEIQ
ncbi:MAG: hypothetical protein ACK41T_02335 [Pseudobdellovibrio sp.]